MKLRISRESLQVLLVVMTFGWGVYTFVWREYLFPLLQPPRLELDSQITEVGPDGSHLVKLSFNLSNPGVRTVYIRNARWFLYELGRQNPGPDRDFNVRIGEVVRAAGDHVEVVRAAGDHVELSSKLIRGRLIAAGPLFDGSSFPAGLSRDISALIKLPPKSQELSLLVYIPHGFRDSRLHGRSSFVYHDDSVQGWAPFLCPSSSGGDVPLASCVSSRSPAFSAAAEDQGLSLLDVDLHFPVGGRSSTVRPK